MIYLLALIPFVIFLGAKIFLNHKFNFQEIILGILACTLVSIGIVQASKMGKMSDTELWNGKVTSKKMVQKNCQKGWNMSRDSFCTEYKTKEVYSHTTTSCSTDSNGNQSCTDTDHYDTYYKYIYAWERKWNVYTTLRNWEISRVDRQGAKEPARWTVVKKHDPVSITKNYDNYIKAVPDSLFNNAAAVNTYSAKVPAYPRVHDLYNVRRVLKVGYKGTIDTTKLNFELGKALGRLNPKKQVNIIIILTGIHDEAYRHAVEFKWVGGKKNDIVLFLGMDGETLVWTDLMTFGKNKFNGILTANLTGAISDMGTIGGANQTELVAVIEKLTMKHYDRPHMKDYEYLKDQIKPSKSALIWAFSLDFIICFVLLFVFHKYDFDPIGNAWRKSDLRWKYNNWKRSRK